MNAPNLCDDPRRTTFLDLVPESLRSQTSNVVLARIRAGAATPTATYYDAIEKLRDRLGGWGAEDPNVRAILGLLVRHRAEAIGYCGWALDWEQLSPAQKDRLRASRGEEYRKAYQEGEPPTEKQRAYLRRLGYQGEPRSKRHASELIDQQLRGRAA
jgi:hypothetical protein